MDPRQLSSLLAIVEKGGFSRAAERLLVAQPSLSPSIATLERELGVQLFHRVPWRTSRWSSSPRPTTTCPISTPSGSPTSRHCGWSWRSAGP